MNETQTLMTKCARYDHNCVQNRQIQKILQQDTIDVDIFNHDLFCQRTVESREQHNFCLNCVIYALSVA